MLSLLHLADGASGLQCKAFPEGWYRMPRFGVAWCQPLHDYTQCPLQLAQPFSTLRGTQGQRQTPIPS